MTQFKNLLKHGPDPYSDVSETDNRTGYLFFNVSAAQLDAGATIYLLCPFTGRIREVGTVEEVTNSTLGSTVKVHANSTDLTSLGGSIAIGATDAAGTANIAEIADDITNNTNLVYKGQVITVVVAAAAGAAGVLSGYVKVSADELVDTNQTAGTDNLVSPNQPVPARLPGQ